MTSASAGGMFFYTGGQYVPVNSRRGSVERMSENCPLKLQTRWPEWGHLGPFAAPIRDPKWRFCSVSSVAGRNLPTVSLVNSKLPCSDRVLFFHELRDELTSVSLSMLKEYPLSSDKNTTIKDE